MAFKCGRFSLCVQIYLLIQMQRPPISFITAHIAQSYGLKINADKTKVITTDGSPANVYLEGIQTEGTDTCLKIIFLSVSGYLTRERS